MEVCNNTSIEKNKQIPVKSVAVAGIGVQTYNAGVPQSLGNLFVMVVRDEDGQCFFFKVPAF